MNCDAGNVLHGLEISMFSKSAFMLVHTAASYIMHDLKKHRFVTRAHVFVSAGKQVTVALTEMKEWTN